MAVNQEGGAPEAPESENGELIRSGYVCILGRPNVGKSTLLNTLMGMRLAAVSPKPQTSRYRILAVLHGPGFQAGLLDTPGWPPTPRVDDLAQRMIRETRQALEMADLVVLMAEPRPPGRVERILIDEIKERGLASIAAINKLDSVRKGAMLPVIESYNTLHPEFGDIIPISVRREDGLDRLLERIVDNLPMQAPLFDPATLTDRSETFIISELIREGIFALYNDEAPYATAVRVETYLPQDPEHGGKDYIEATVFVERESLRGILVGRGGLALKQVGVQARPEIERLLGRPVMLSLWVRTQPRWRKDSRFLSTLEE